MSESQTINACDLNEVWETEPNHFTPWLAKEENLTLLGKNLGMELELEAQEINVGDFRADILSRAFHPLQYRADKFQPNDMAGTYQERNRYLALCERG